MSHANLGEVSAVSVSLKSWESAGPGPLEPTLEVGAGIAIPRNGASKSDQVTWVLGPVCGINGCISGSYTLVHRSA